MSDYSAAATRAQDYARRRHLTLVDQLGSGADGVIFSTEDRTAVKVFRYQQQYVNERNV